MKTFTQWLALLAGTAVSLVANVEHMDGPLASRVLGASVPVLMAFGVHLSGGIRNRYANWASWTAVALAFFVSYQSSYELMGGWGMSDFQAALFPLVPEAVMIVALIGLAEGVTERRENRQQAVRDRQADEENRQALAALRQRPSATVTQTPPADIKRQAIVNRMDQKRRDDIRLMANHWPGLSFLEIPEDERKRVVRRTLTTPEKSCGPEKAERLVRIYLEHLESTLTNETQES